MCKKQIYSCSNFTGEGIKKVISELNNLHDKNKN